MTSLIWSFAHAYYNSPLANDLLTKKCWKSYKSTSLSMPVMNSLIIPESAGETSFILLNSLPLLNFFEREKLCTKTELQEYWACLNKSGLQSLAFDVKIGCIDNMRSTILGAKLALKPITTVMACSRLSLSGKKWYSCLSVTELLARQFHSYNYTTSNIGVLYI